MRDVMTAMVTADDLMIDVPGRPGIAVEVFHEISEVERPGL